MEEQTLTWIYVGTGLAALAALPILFQIITRVGNFFYEILSLKNLSIRVMRRRSYRGVPHVTIKSALVGKGELIVNEVVIESKLKYTRGIEGVWAWLRLITGYFLDDVEGLNNVLGRSFPSIVWIPVLPFHTINRWYVRKPLNVISGIITVWYFLICWLPPLWPLLLSGPYQELRLYSGDEDIKLSEKISKVELKRPFIIKAGFERDFSIGYRPSLLYFNTFFKQKVFIKNARVLYVKGAPKLGKTELPRSSGFTWKVTDILRVKIRGKVRGYPVKLGDSYVGIHL